MKHYNFQEIKTRGSCIDFVEQILNSKVTDNRCVATWRNGERDSVSIDKEKWFDHATQQGGGLIELCAITKFGSADFTAIQQAQEFLFDCILRKARHDFPSRSVFDDSVRIILYHIFRRVESDFSGGKIGHFPPIV